MGPTFLAAGVTTVRDTGNDLGWILQQRELNEKRSDRGPTIVCCGHLQDGPEKYWPRMGTANADADAVRRSIREHIEAGADAIKLYPGLDAEMTAAGIDETHRLGKPVTAHLGTCDVEDAVAAGLDCIEHLARCDVAWRAAAPEEDDELIDLLLKHEAAIDPTLVIFDRGVRKLDLVFRRDESLRWVHPAHRRYWESGPPQIDDAEAQLERHRTNTHVKRFLKRAHERGVIVAIGTDTPFPRLTPGFSLHDEMGLYADAGIAPVDVLRSATSVNARSPGYRGASRPDRARPRRGPGRRAGQSARRHPGRQRGSDGGAQGRGPRSRETTPRSRGHLRRNARRRNHQRPAGPARNALASSSASRRLPLQYGLAVFPWSVYPHGEAMRIVFASRKT